MAQLESHGVRNNLFINSFLILLSLICPSYINAQSPSDFSGIWVMDNSKSDAQFKEFEITLSIKQNPQTITLQETFVTKGEKNTSNPSTFNLDGIVTSKEEYGGINKTSSKWSSDNKVLTLTTIRTVNGTDYGSDIIYELSADGKVLTVQSISIAPPGGPELIQVFNKK